MAIAGRLFELFAKNHFQTLPRGNAGGLFERTRMPIAHIPFNRPNPRLKNRMDLKFQHTAIEEIGPFKKGKIGGFFRKFRNLKITKVKMEERKKCYNSPKELFPDIEKFRKWAGPETGRFSIFSNHNNFAASRPAVTFSVSFDSLNFSLSNELYFIPIR